MNEDEESFCGHIIRANPDGAGFLIFRAGPFPTPCKPGFERARADTLEEAREMARLLFCGIRAEDIEVQMRDARRNESSRESTRGSTIEEAVHD